MELFSGAKVIRTYKIALGGSPVGPKRQQGDHKTPEGKYVISGRNDKSSYHLSLRVSYPNQSDKKQASTRGVKTGSDIMIHGLPNGMGSIGSAHLLQDWTDGCIAVTDEEMEEIWKLVSVGTEIEILP